MTDLVTSYRGDSTRFRMLGLSLSKLNFAPQITTFLSAYGKALEMAYIDPYQSGVQKNSLHEQCTPDGRDPNW